MTMQVSFIRRRWGFFISTAAVSCGLLFQGQVWGVTRTYTLVQANSSITVGGTINTTNYGSGNIVPQSGTSLTTTYQGTILADRQVNTVNTIELFGGSTIDADMNGSWQPLPGGGSGSQSADYGGKAS